MAKKANCTNIAIFKVSLKSNESVYKHLEKKQKIHFHTSRNHVISISDAGTDT